mgnify:CR=1 FL=1
MMTFISQWLAAEEPDKTEPAGYYIPGSDEWESNVGPYRYGRRAERLRREIEEVYMELLEEEE